MKKLIYDIALNFFPLVLWILSPVHQKSRLMSRGRKNWKQSLLSQEFRGKRIWFHCASLGEFEQGRPLMEAVKRNDPDCSVIITFFSSSGYEIRKDYELADYICYLPFDSKKNSREFVEALKPDAAIFIKYEFWYYYLSELRKHQIPTFSVSAIFRLDQRFIRKQGEFFSEILLCFTHYFVQNAYSESLLKSLGFDNVTISGDTRFDRVAEICARPREIEQARVFKGNSKLMVIGSSWPEDMDVLLPVINDSNFDLKYIIAPHEINPGKISNLCSGLKVKYQLFSKADTETLSQCKVLIIDNIGMLSSLYQYGEIAYIGGAFGEGLHNILEAATFGKAIIFGQGKDNYKYQEAIDLVKEKGAFEIADTSEVKAVLEIMLTDETALEEASKISKAYVFSKTGATKIIMDYLAKYL